MAHQSSISKPASWWVGAGLLTLAGGFIEGSAIAQTSSASAPAPLQKQAQDFDAIYRQFYQTYRLGSNDELAIRVLGQPDYSIERGKISPIGRIYHPLLGDLDVAGLTVDQLTQRLTKDLSEYLINPKVSVSLLEARSAKIAVLGEVIHPGIVVMAEPMTVLDAISASGGFADTGSKANVSLLRQTGQGQWRTLQINVDRILKGRAGAEENLQLRAGDTVIVQGNAKKKLTNIISLTGFASFLSFIAGAR
jgi:polysaccharide export outer membrane protein